MTWHSHIRVAARALEHVVGAPMAMTAQFDWFDEGYDIKTIDGRYYRWTEETGMQARDIDYETMAHEMLVAEADARLQIAESALVCDPSPETIVAWLDAMEEREAADDPKWIAEGAAELRDIEEDERELTSEFFGNK